MKIYKIKFSDDTGAAMEISVRDLIPETEDVNTADEVVRLTGASSPFVISMASVMKSYAPVRYTTARLNVLQTSGERLDLTDNMRYLVEVRNLDAEQIVWRGFIRAELYTQEYSSTPEKITYNCVDLVGSAESVCLQDRTLSMHDALVLLCNAIPWDDDDDERDGALYVGSSVPLSPETGVSSETFHLETKAEHWRDYGNETTYVKRKTCMDFFSEWCTLFGVTLYSNGRDIYVGGKDDTGYFLALSLPELGMMEDAHREEIFRSIEERDIYTLTSAGRHTLTVQQPCTHVSLSYGGREYITDGMPSPDGDHMSVEFYGSEIGTNSQGSSFPWFAVYGHGKNGVMTYRRRVTSDGYGEEVESISYRNWMWYGGAAIVRMDYWATGEEWDAGSGDWKGKYNYDLKDVLVLFGRDTSTGTTMRVYHEYDERDNLMSAIGDAASGLSARLDRPLVVMVSDNPISIRGKGGLRISFSYAMDCGELFPLNASVGADGGETALICALKIGDKWWNGGSWSNDEVKFAVPMLINDTKGGERNNVTTKRLTENYVCDGYSIDCDGANLHGTMRLTIYGVGRTSIKSVEHAETNTITYKGVVDVPDVVKIWDFSLAYCQAFDEEVDGSPTSPTDTISETRGGGGQDEEYTTGLCSGIGVRDNDGIIEGARELLDLHSGEMCNAEKIAFDRLRRSAFAATERLTITTSAELELLPTENYLAGGAQYRLETIDEVNISTNTKKITLVKL